MPYLDVGEEALCSEMRLRWFFIVVMLAMTACVQHGEIPGDKVRAMCEQTVKAYPAATLQDVYKTCYQDFFGANTSSVTADMCLLPFSSSPLSSRLQAIPLRCFSSLCRFICCTN